MTDSGGLAVKLHPLVLINISEHYTRLTATAEGAGGQGMSAEQQQKVEQEKGLPAGSLASTSSEAGEPSVTAGGTVIGALYGKQLGLDMHILHSFEMKVQSKEDGSYSIESDHLEKTVELMVAVFPTYECLGWYTIGSALTDSHMATHKAMLKHNESPLFLLLNPDCGEKLKELPLSIYSSETKMVDEVPKLVFVEKSYEIVTDEAERVAVDHVAKVGIASEEGSVMCPHFERVQNSISNINKRTKVLRAFLQQTKEGKIPKNHRLLRQVASICNQLPSLDSEQFQKDFSTEYIDSLLLTYLSTITSGSHAANEVMEKVSAAYANRRGR